MGLRIWDFCNFTMGFRQKFGCEIGIRPPPHPLSGPCSKDPDLLFPITMLQLSDAVVNFKEFGPLCISALVMLRNSSILILKAL